MSDPIPLTRPFFDDREVEAVRAVLESGWVAGQGPRGAELEQRFADRCHAAHAVAVSNCTAALHLSFLALGVGPGDEVLVADYTYPATGHAVCFTGATPVFVDVRADTFTIDPDAAAALIGPRTVGIVAVDAFGQCADYEPLRALAERHDLFLLEDAACSVGATYRGHAAGSLADVACFSLHARKGATSGEGGVLVTDDGELAERARKLSSFGVESAFARQDADDLPVPVFDQLGYNYKLSDIQAAIALVQLDRLDEQLAGRRRVAECYGRRLNDLERVTVPVVAGDRDHTWQSYVVTLDRRLPRGRVAARVRARGVQTNIGTYASHLQPVYGPQESRPVSADLFARHLSIPMYAALTDADIARVADTLVQTLDEALA
ncbi:MAG TPA: DegT/DnrJ/EryC1/StrS family aminotransferase [Acidimicrobiia bacterium]|nr:DegT/DnrJ/EryC1/StrS family aminotransferase [Acidimicrobiia bacterium]